jgi:polysaccharide biosynthesis transport protein
MLRDHMDHTEIDRGERSASVPAIISTYSVPAIVPAAGDSVRLTELTAPLLQRKVTVALIGAIGLVAGLVVSILTTPSFRARASLQLEGFNDEQFFRSITPISLQIPNATPESYLQNQVKVLQSETLARRVANKLGMQSENEPVKTPGFLSRIRNRFGISRSWPTTPENRSMQKVQDNLTVRTSMQSQVIELLYDAPDPIAAALGANAAASEFIELNREARAQVVKDSTEWLRKQAADMKIRLEAANRQLQDYARTSGLVFAGTHSTLAEDRMRQIQDALSRAEADRAAKQSRYETTLANGGDPVTDAVSTGPLKEYQVNLQTMRRELAQLRTLYTPSHYKVQSLMAQIAETEKAIDNERKEILGRIRNEYQTGAGLEQLLSRAHERQLRTVEQQMQKERHYDVLKSEIDTTQKLYDSMLQKVEEAGVASALRSTNVRIIDSATPPSSPYTPKTALNMAIGLVIGTFLGVGLVFVSERTVKVKSPGESLLNVPELGVIPSARDALDLPRRSLIRLRPRSTGVGIVTWNQGSSIWSEAFRGALTSILFSIGRNRGPRNPVSGRQRGRTLVVTSIDAAEGKTTVLGHLGIAAAERKQRVLLIDADLRRPRLHELFHLSNERGLTDLLQRSHSVEFVDNSPLNALAQQTQVPDLWVLTRGPEGGPGSLLYSADLSGILQRFKREFDLILIDTAPMSLYSDARFLGRLSDGVVMVVRSNTKSREELQAAYMRFVQDQIPVLGTILNDWSMDAGQCRSYKRYYHDYQAQSVSHT